MTGPDAARFAAEGFYYLQTSDVFLQHGIQRAHANLHRHEQRLGDRTEGEEHRDIRYDERDRPGELRALQPASPVPPERLPPDWRPANICN